MKKWFAVMMTLFLILGNMLSAGRSRPLSAAPAYPPRPVTPPSPMPLLDEPDTADRPPHTPPTPGTLPPEVEQARALSMFARHGSTNVRLKGATSKNGASETPGG